MPIDVSWYDSEKTIVQLDFIKPHITTWDEYHSAVDAAVTLADEVTHPIVMIFLANDTPMPSGAPLLEMRKAVNLMPNHVLLAITAIDRSPFERMMLGILQKLTRYKIQTYIVSTREEAVKLARKKLKEATSNVMSR